MMALYRTLSCTTGVLAPVPAYPLYQATLKLYNGTLVPYYLNEEEDWQLDLGNLKDAVAKVLELLETP